MVRQSIGTMDRVLGGGALGAGSHDKREKSYLSIL